MRSDGSTHTKECANGKPIGDDDFIPVVELVVRPWKGMHDEMNRGHDISDRCLLSWFQTLFILNVHKISLHQQNTMVSHVSEETSSYVFAKANMDDPTATFPNA